MPEFFGHFRKCPIVVTGSKCDGNSLTFFKIMNSFDCFHFTGHQRRVKTFFAVKCVQRAFGTVSPGKQGCIGAILKDSFVCFIHIETPDSFSPGIQKNDGRMEAIHGRIVLIKNWKLGHPAALLVHGGIGLEHIGFFFRLKNHT